jgi:phage terminase large subunit
LLTLNKKFTPLFGSDNRYYVVTGGRGSGKSYSVTMFLLMLTYEVNHVILFTRFTLVSAHISIIPEFIEKIELIDRFSDFHITKDEIINLKTGSKILFKGIKTSSGQQTANLKSLSGVTTWVLDEAEELTDEDVFDKIDLSIRSQQKQNRVILILNPATKEHFIYKRFFEQNGVNAGDSIEKNGVTYIHTTYLDNIDNLSESFINQIESVKQHRPEKYKHQILGGWLDKAEGVIFTNWTMGEFKEVSTLVFGQDYGFSNDPTTLIKTSIDNDKKRIYIKEMYYLQQLSTTQIKELNRVHAGSHLIIGDSSEPRLISEIGVEPAEKGQGSVTFGISILQDYDLIIDPSSTNLISELNNYVWLEKKSKTPIDKYNHGIDALRYAVTYQLTNAHKGVYNIY